jgi:hypothetical protein
MLEYRTRRVESACQIGRFTRFPSISATNYRIIMQCFNQNYGYSRIFWSEATCLPPNPCLKCGYHPGPRTEPSFVQSPESRYHSPTSTVPLLPLSDSARGDLGRMESIHPLVTTQVHSSGHCSSHYSIDINPPLAEQCKIIPSASRSTGVEILPQLRHIDSDSRAGKIGVLPGYPRRGSSESAVHSANSHYFA